jgi:hypothetical protein
LLAPADEPETEPDERVARGGAAIGQQDSYARFPSERGVKFD